MRKPIKDFEHYEIDEFGNVYSLRTKKVLKPLLRKDGYYQVGLHKDGKKHMKMIHRLIAETFIENPMCKAEVNHIDGNRGNYSLDNLEWCTRVENQRHAWETGLHGEKHRESSRRNLSLAGKKHWRTNLDKARKRWVEVSSKPIKQIDKEGNVICIYKSMSEAKRVTGINNIGMVVTNKLKTSGGYRWEYCGEEQNDDRDNS